MASSSLRWAWASPRRCASGVTGGDHMRAEGGLPARVQPGPPSGQTTGTFVRHLAGPKLTGILIPRLPLRPGGLLCDRDGRRCHTQARI
eukprot:scaffold15486_cov111-Isochrysis_galbana.AAC.9